MKAIKYLMMGALTLSLSLPAAAQDDSKAVIAQATQIIKSKTNVDAQLKPILKANKKNVPVILGIAHAYLDQKDYANAQKYIDMALARNSKSCEAWILQGDLYVAQDDGGKAAGAYQQAKYADPSNPEGYYRYAMVLRSSSPSEAVSNLEDLRKYRPDYPVDALAGRIFYRSAKPDYDKAIEYYGRVQDVTSMEDADITDYATITWMKGQREKSIDVCKKALAKNARKPAWNRLAFYNYTDLKQPTEALEYADRLFNKSDSAHIIAEDYVYLATAQKLAGKVDDALASYQKAIDLSADNKAQQANCYKQLKDVYLEKGDYDQAVASYEKYLASLEEPTFESMDDLGTLYTDIAAKKSKANDEAGAKAAFQKADGVYGQLLEKFPEYKSYGNYMRAQINYNLDPDGKQGLAKPYYDKVIEAINAKAEKSKSDVAMLRQAYTYMLVYSFNVAKDIPTAKSWAQKLLEVDPENETAKQVVEMQ